MMKFAFAKKWNTTWIINIFYLTRCKLARSFQIMHIMQIAEIPTRAKINRIFIFDIFVTYHNDMNFFKICVTSRSIVSLR